VSELESLSRSATWRLFRKRQLLTSNSAQPAVLGSVEEVVRFKLF